MPYLNLLKNDLKPGPKLAHSVTNIFRKYSPFHLHSAYISLCRIFQHSILHSREPGLALDSARWAISLPLRFTDAKGRVLKIQTQLFPNDLAMDFADVAHFSLLHTYTKC